MWAGALTDEIASLKRRLLTATEDSQQKVLGSSLFRTKDLYSFCHMNRPLLPYE